MGLKMNGNCTQWWHGKLNGNGHFVEQTVYEKFFLTHTVFLGEARLCEYMQHTHIVHM